MDEPELDADNPENWELQQDGLIVRYIGRRSGKVVRKDQNHSTAIRLSEGEKHFLSFLYFYHMVRSCAPDGSIPDRVVVIDDPVSIKCDISPMMQKKTCRGRDLWHVWFCLWLAGRLRF